MPTNYLNIQHIEKKSCEHRETWKPQLALSTASKLATSSIYWYVEDQTVLHTRTRNTFRSANSNTGRGALRPERLEIGAWILLLFRLLRNGRNGP